MTNRDPSVLNEKMIDIVARLSISLCIDRCLRYFVFFFQAEDGIRDVERSRGLGDVNKRQDYS